jgi:hypothetical protein
MTSSDILLSDYSEEGITRLTLNNAKRLMRCQRRCWQHYALPISPHGNCADFKKTGWSKRLFEMNRISQNGMAF